MEREDQKIVYKLNASVSYVPKTENPLDDVIDIIDDHIEHKKTTHLYVPPQFKTAPSFKLETQAIDNEFAKIKEQFDRVGNLDAEQKNQKQTVKLVDDIIKEKNPFQNVGIEDIWIEDDLYDSKDSEHIIDASKKIIDEITLNPLIHLNIVTPPNTDDEMVDKIDNNIDFTITDSQLVEGNDANVNRNTESFVDFTETDSRIVDSDDGIKSINVTIYDNIVIPNSDVIGRDTASPRPPPSLPQPKKMVTSHLNQAVREADKIKKKYRQKQVS